MKIGHYIKLAAVTTALLFNPAWASAAGAADVATILAGMAKDPDAREAAIEAGSKTATFCANCHGQSGVSAIPDVPNLAAQHPAYLLRQIESFVSGDRKNPFMEGLMKALSPDERAQLVLYYTTRTPPAAAQSDAALVAAGGKAYASLCAQCHGADGHGNAQVPRLAGQQEKYLRVSLKRYLTMSGERIYPPMTAQVTKLGEPRIDAVVAYLRSLP
ncbi:c-type cytochrome [Nitrogeniibacter aestuarii]|uniref:c-type cytochrome n=1 Tax=Nitrogeniibacter aestuarii TaxID=2815343 RepID=UPI001E55B4C9|nr:c-type cytochrome [Nitrogeniibacter aestuarii]